MEDETQHQAREKEPRRESADPEGNFSGVSARHPDRMTGAHQVQGDFRTGISGAHNQGRPFLQLSGIPVLARMELNHSGIELAREARYLASLVRGHGHDHMFGLIPMTPRRDEVVAPIVGETLAPGCRFARAGRIA